jgi:2-polyprenyl-3-methyl-5-hydroxy-6-metoxy-1,4-benzoquinol methylase
MHTDNEFKPSHTAFDISKYENHYEYQRSKIIEELMPLGHGESAIDIGCGPGHFSKMLSAKDWQTAAIDTDGKNIDSAARYASETHLGDATGVLMKLPENKYGLVIALEVIEHMPRTHAECLLKQIIRVLRPSGKLIVSTPNRFSPEGLGDYYWGEKIRRQGKWYAWDQTHVHIYSSLEILRLLRTIGFSVDRVTGYHYEGRLPFIGRWGLPIVKSKIFPLNSIGFNIILECHKLEYGTTAS